MIALVTTRSPSHPDEEIALLADGLRAAGLSCAIEEWDDPSANWGAYEHVVIRSPWNYVQHQEAFSQWIASLPASVCLHNRADVVVWNMHKGYLVELTGAGFAVVPTQVLRRAADPDPAILALQEGVKRGGAVVLKPAVSAGSFATLRVDADDVAKGIEHARTHVPARDMLLQPFLPAVGVEGERNYIFMDGDFSHAVQKRARFANEAASVTPWVNIDPAEMALAEKIIAWVGERFSQVLPYGRVDLATDTKGASVLMELELIEPDLYLRHDVGAMARFVAMARRRFAAR